MKHTLLLSTTTMLLMLLFACSSGNSPLEPLFGDISQIKTNPVGISDYLCDSALKGRVAGMGTMGMFQLHLDPVRVTGEMVSLRHGMLPDVLEVVDITNFLQLWPCTDCVKLQSISLDNDGNLVASIGIKHPFEEGDPFKPITGRNRGDLHVFNVEGIVISNNPAITFPGIGRNTADFRLLNASGYTGYLDAVINDFFPTSATIHPYILHFDDYSSGNFDPNNPMGFESVTDPPPSGNLVMPMGSDYDFKDYVFDLSEGAMEFIFAVGCTYAVSAAIKDERFDPEFRVPQHLKKAASEVWVKIVENNLAGEDVESSATLHINVVDVNHGVPVGDALNEMLADSSVSGVSVEIPGITDGEVNFSTTPISGTGRDPDDPLIFEVEITNAAGGDEGTYLGLVKITDSYPPGLNESPLLGGQDGIERVDPIVNPLEGLFAIVEFATYQVFSIEVIQTNEPPVCEINYCLTLGSTSLNIGGKLQLDGLASYDPDGTIESYEWDFDYDGVDFYVDASGEIVGYECLSAGTNDVALKVTDNRGGYSICSVPIECNDTPREWGSTSKVTNTPEDWRNVLASTNGNSMVVTSDCMVHLVYFTWKTSYPYERTVLYTNYDGLSWSVPVEIHRFDIPYVMTVAMDKDSEDNIHGVFCMNHQIWHFTNSSGSWELESLDQGIYGFENISFVVNSQDHMMIAVSSSDFDLNTVDQLVYYENTGSGWSSQGEIVPVCLYRTSGSSFLSAPDLFLTPDDRFHIVYTGIGFPPCPSDDPARVFHAEYDGLQWIDHGVVSDFAGSANHARAFSDSKGNIHSVFTASNRVFYGKRDAATGTWSSFQNISSSTTGSNMQPDIYIDRWDQAHLVWYRDSRLGIHKTFDALNDTATDIQALPENMIPSVLGGDIWYVHVHVDFNGDAHVVYEDTTLGWNDVHIGYARYH